VTGVTVELCGVPVQVPLALIVWPPNVAEPDHGVGAVSARTAVGCVVGIDSLSLGRLSYSVRGGRTKRASIRLSNAAYNLLEKVAGHRWNATVRSSATLGTVTGTVLEMTGPPPPRR